MFTVKLLAQFFLFCGSEQENATAEPLFAFAFSEAYSYSLKQSIL